MLIADLTAAHHGIRTRARLIQYTSLQPIFIGFFYYHMFFYNQVSQLVFSLQILQVNFKHLSCPMRAAFPANIMFLNFTALFVFDKDRCNLSSLSPQRLTSCQWLLHMTSESDLGSAKSSTIFTPQSSKIYFSCEDSFTKAYLVLQVESVTLFTFVALKAYVYRTKMPIFHNTQRTAEVSNSYSFSL